MTTHPKDAPSGEPYDHEAAVQAMAKDIKSRGLCGTIYIDGWGERVICTREECGGHDAINGVEAILRRIAHNQSINYREDARLALAELAALREREAEKFTLPDAARVIAERMAEHAERIMHAGDGDGIGGFVGRQVQGGAFQDAARWIEREFTEPPEVSKP
jgi:hypothetical protein